MSETLETPPVLAIHFDPKTLKELDIVASQLVITSSHQPTKLAKTGLQALLAKTPLSKDTPVPMDIDIACGLYDEKGELLEVVWYGNLRNKDESVRHNGDTFIGMNKEYQPSTVQETLVIRYGLLDKRIHRLAIFVHSATNAPLRKALSGQISLHDNENTRIHQIEFATLDEKTTGLCAWQLVRTFDDDFRITALSEPVVGKTAGELAKKWSISTPI